MKYQGFGHIFFTRTLPNCTCWICSIFSTEKVARTRSVCIRSEFCRAKLARSGVQANYMSTTMLPSGNIHRKHTLLRVNARFDVESLLCRFFVIRIELTNRCGLRNNATAPSNPGGQDKRTTALLFPKPAS